MYNLDLMTIEEIKMCIEQGILTEQDVIDYYNNEWWDERP